ncbi:hypothetical protein BJY01DRAFT_247552 [Aspergillus pseudoustus]|uniref:Uncharacterized protein n=1 Tax=Aspergillus pseudoustus TaxID=1810923 RepID=A0ABR4K0A6_9EURO
MFSNTFDQKFLVLAPIQHSPLAVSNEQGETATAVRDRAGSQSSTASGRSGFLYLGHDIPNVYSPVRERSDSQSSTASGIRPSRTVSRLPGGFLFLGHDINTSPVVRPRSDSQSSSASSTRRFSRNVSRLPGGFLYLGHD